MFASLYNDEPDDGLNDYDTPFANASSSYKYRPENCASLLDMPEKQRDPREFAGLRNQGATCYMNSFIQTLYMIHDFRNAIFNMPLCVDNPQTSSGFLEGQKYQILFSLQKLFVQLKEGTNIAASTVELTDSFGWKSNQQMVQHDVQELMREFLGVLDRALKGTAFENLVKDTFGGIKSNIIQVPDHGIYRARDENFEDILVQVRGCGDLETSLREYFNFESLSGDNQYFCEEVNQKVDALKGVKIKRFPKILTVSLLRFDLDYTTFELKKLNEEFKFPLELHLNDYLTGNSEQQTESIDYELLSCIIHIGNVGGGHYKAYIRDYSNEGTWDFDLYNKEDRREAEAKDKDADPTKQDKKEEPKQEEKIDYDGDFPIPYQNPELGQHWYEFNDSYVRPIVAGRLESQFGNGSSNQNAYILMYKRKGVDENPIYEDIPTYWVEDIQKQNESGAKEREIYEIERNKLEIYLQPQALFSIKVGEELKYAEQKDTEEQGVKIKFTFSTTVKEFKEMVRKELGLGEGTDFDGFEVCQLSNQLCQVFRAISDCSEELTIKDTEITHLSTWLITVDPEIRKHLYSVKGMEKEPIFINFKHKNDENRTIWYRDMLCSDFLEEVAKKYGYPSWKHIKCTYFTDGIIRRIDRLKYDVEKQCDHTLKSLSVGDNAQIVIDGKTEEEMKTEEENANKQLQTDFIDPSAETTATVSDQGINVDETENIRSVIMHKEEDPEFLERFNIDIDWTIGEMHEKLKQFMGIPKDEERRLRREIDNSLIVLEELGVKCREYPDFQEGGVRLKLEYGRFPAIEELALTVAIYGNLDFRLRFYFKKDTTIFEGKEKICQEFGLEPRKYRIWRTDIYEDPQYIVKKERQVWEKNHIANGDFLIIKSEEDILPDEQVIVDIHETKTGIPNDCQSIGHVKVKDSDTIDELKEAILAMEEYADRSELAHLSTDQIRLRQRSRNLFFGTIFREKNKTLKHLKIKSGMHLVVQFLPEAESLQNNEMLLLVRKRDIKNMDYHEFLEFKYNFEKALPTLDHLRQKLGEVVGLRAENIDIAKYIPHAYDWKYWDPTEDVEIKKKGKGKNNKGKGKGKKNKDEQTDEKKEEPTETQKLTKCDLRTAPFLLAEGDILGYRDHTDAGADTDDFQTAADIQNRERLEELKKLDKETKTQMGKKQNFNNDPFKIYTDF